MTGENAPSRGHFSFPLYGRTYEGRGKEHTGSYEMGCFAMTMQKDNERLKDVRKLKKILKLVPADRKDIAEKLMIEISFVAETLADLREKIKENGTVDHFKQGKQEFLRESPALKSYNTTIQRYSLLYKQLTDLLPPPEVDNKKKNEVLDFITKQG